jgi:hypothetical protein
MDAGEGLSEALNEGISGGLKESLLNTVLCKY